MFHADEVIISLGIVTLSILESNGEYPVNHVTDGVNPDFSRVSSDTGMLYATQLIQNNVSPTTQQLVYMEAIAHTYENQRRLNYDNSALSTTTDNYVWLITEDGWKARSASFIINASGSLSGTFGTIYDDNDNLIGQQCSITLNINYGYSNANLAGFSITPLVATLNSDGTINETLFVINPTSFGTTNYNVNIYRITSTQARTNNALLLNHATQEITPTSDPFEGGGLQEYEDQAEGFGGTGTFDGTSDDIGFPSLPALSAVDTGLVSLYAPSLAQINALANYLWSNDFDLDTFKKLLYDPMDVIIGMSIIPVTPPTAGSRAVGLGNLVSTISMPVVASQYVAVDCGSLNVQEYWGAFLDYSPYTKAQIFLPYIGIRQIDVDDIMGKTVQIMYYVDVLTGGCVAMIKCGGSVLYSFGGQCAINIPVSSADWTNTIQGLLQTVAGIVGGAVAGGGAGAVMGGITAASNAIMQGDAKPTIHRSGALSGSNGILGLQKPYMILTRPRQAVPAGQNEIIGYPSNVSTQLGNLSGFTQVQDIHLEGIPGTDAELQEIENLLKGGVIL